MLKVTIGDTLSPLKILLPNLTSEIILKGGIYEFKRVKRNG